MSYTVFYFNPSATPEICDAIRAELPAGWTLLTTNGSTDHAAELRASDFILVADRAITAADLDAAPRLRLIQLQGVGYDRIDLDACRARGIPVSLTPEGTSVGVAEHTLLLILALYKQLLTAANGARQGRWLQWELRPSSHELSGKTLGLVGFGRIGREVAHRARAFGANLIYFDPFTGSVDTPVATRIDALETLLRQADIVSLHLPLTPATRHLICASTLSQMKPGAVLINTSRGALVDEAALAVALDRQHLSGAGLDVLSQEPPAKDHPLLQRADVLITPHISAGSQEALTAKMHHAFANMQRHTRGETLHHRVPELIETQA